MTGVQTCALPIWNNGDEFVGAWNFGPLNENSVSVTELVNSVSQTYGEKLVVKVDKQSKPLETNNLSLDASKSRLKLKWNSKLDLDESINWTVDWYKSFRNKKNMRKISLEQIDRFIDK